MYKNPSEENISIFSLFHIKKLKELCTQYILKLFPNNELYNQYYTIIEIIFNDTIYKNMSIIKINIITIQCVILFTEIHNILNQNSKKSYDILDIIYIYYSKNNSDYK
jgi:hypothetical protein